MSLKLKMAIVALKLQTLEKYNTDLTFRPAYAGLFLCKKENYIYEFCIFYKSTKFCKIFTNKEGDLKSIIE